MFKELQLKTEGKFISKTLPLREMHHVDMGFETRDHSNNTQGVPAIFGIPWFRPSHTQQNVIFSFLTVELLVCG